MCIKKSEKPIETYQQWEDHMMVMSDLESLMDIEIKLIKKIICEDAE